MSHFAWLRGLSFVFWGGLISWYLHVLWLLGGLWCLSSFVAGGVVNSTSNLFAAPPAHDVGFGIGVCWGL